MDNCVNFGICGNERATSSFYCTSCSKIRNAVTEECHKGGITNRYIIQDYITTAIQLDASKRLAILIEERQKQLTNQPKKPIDYNRGISMDPVELEKRRQQTN